MSEYEFDQMFAEAVVRIGLDACERYLTAVARILGWPIPEKHRQSPVLSS
jgi:hypothetical protein